ncbi:MAG: hypothetical protein IJ408_03890 [Clostridia bacterium]|nr:hypothetical protein [Clostridia bacterium]
MKKLNTVTGTVCREDAGLICPHEHLFLDMTHEAVEPKTDAEKELFYGDIRMENLGVLRRNPYIVKTNLVLDDVDTAVSEASFLDKYGCNLLIDVTTVGLGRDLKKLKEFCERSDLQVVCGTGLFVHDTLAEYEDMTPEQIAAWMIDEIENGEKETGIKPGVIGEIGTSEVIYPIERKSLIAAAMVSAKTELPIYLHTYSWSRAGLEAVDLLLENGAAPENICICHLDVTFDDEYIYEVLSRGVYLEFDNFGKEFYFEEQDGAFSGGPFETDVARVRKLAEIIEKGYADRLLLANDLCLKASLRKYGGWGYDHVFCNIIPMMKMEGISEDNISLIIKENPKRFLFGE